MTMRHEPTEGLYGWITHTKFASSDPEATKNWRAKVFGWDFKPSFPTPDGDYHLFAYSEQGGGGIRQGHPSERPNSLPFVHVENTQEAFDKALREGAEAVSPPISVMEGVTTAIVRAPGGILVGISGP
jgi:predicted enzyme related to lactoylglutathione lyase